MKVPTPRKLPSGQYRVQVMVGGERASVTNADPKIAVAMAMQAKAKLIELTQKPKKITLDAAIQNYMEIRSNVLSPSTIRGYDMIRKHRFSDLMEKNIYTLTRQEIQKSVNAEAARLSPKTVKNAYSLICAVGADHGLDFNGAKLPQRKRVKKDYLSISEIADFIDAARGDTCEIPIVMAVWLGMRRSEITGLCWDCVNFERSEIEIRRGMVMNKENKWVLKDVPKNIGSERVLKCPSYIMSKLKAIYKPTNNGLVFTYNPSTIIKHIHSICNRFGIKDTTIHGLRHANAAVMVMLNITDKCAMARGGWTSEYTFKQIYSYVFQEDANAADAAVNSFFEKLIS